MKIRYHIGNNTHFAEFEKTLCGLQQAKDFRSDNTSFKGRHIIEVIQAYPSRVPLGVGVEWTFGTFWGF